MIIEPGIYHNNMGETHEISPEVDLTLSGDVSVTHETVQPETYVVTVDGSLRLSAAVSVSFEDGEVLDVHVMENMVLSGLVNVLFRGGDNTPTNYNIQVYGDVVLRSSVVVD